MVHISGCRASLYFATFPPDYLSTIQNENVDALKNKFEKPIGLYHTKVCNLMDGDDREKFLVEFIAVVRCLADGNAPIGYLRRDPGGKIHRKPDDKDEVSQPPQEVLNAKEMAEWRQEFVDIYGP